MYSISDIMADIDRGCLSNNMVEDRFLYRIIFFVNDRKGNSKYYVDAQYRDLRKSLENIVKDYLTTENNVVVAQTTILKGRKCISLQSRAYMFSLEDYFRQINGEYTSRNKHAIYGRYVVR